MSKIRVLIAVGCCACALMLTTFAQAARKPGLWEITANMTWQQSPMPSGMTMPGAGPHTTQVCLTQAQIDRYGAPISQGRDCQVTNISFKPNGMTGGLVCTGHTVGKGEVQASWTDSTHATGRVHFLGTMQAGPKSVPVEWTVDSSSVFKSSDCGSVQPAPMPAK
ncbi:MAG: DUF3617 family protein [Terracidiphilus sp.]|jgi:hypothetical protein